MTSSFLRFPASSPNLYVCVEAIVKSKLRLMVDTRFPKLIKINLGFLSWWSITTPRREPWTFIWRTYSLACFQANQNLTEILDNAIRSVFPVLFYTPCTWPDFPKHSSSWPQINAYRHWKVSLKFCLVSGTSSTLQIIKKAQNKASDP